MSETPRTPATPGTPGTPGSLAMEMARAQNSALAEFKKPTELVRRKNKPKILTEEKYVEEMAKIIQRDFFPDLEKLRAQNDYLDAESRRDFVQMSEIRERYSLGRIPGMGSSRRGSRLRNQRNNAMSPATFETPVSNNGSSTPLPPSRETNRPNSPSPSEKSSAESCVKGIASKMSLDVFLHNYTSEDNNSFQEIIETAEAKLRQKYAVLFNCEKMSAERLQRALTLPSIEKQFEGADPMRMIETWKYTNMNSVMYVPDGVELTDEERVQAAKRKQSIQHKATRLPDEAQYPEGASNKKADAVAILDACALSTGDGTATPRFRGYDLLRTPSPRPGEDFSPIMTWGEIDGTPFRLDGGDTPMRPTQGPSFRINENSRRENIALALAEKVSEKMRNQKQMALDTARKNIGSPLIRSSMERLASMSPAAQRFATGKIGIRASPVMPHTPSPNRFKRQKVTPGVVRSNTPQQRQTPQQLRTISTPSKNTPIDTGSTLTDDLLKIPTKRRATAADFF
ncbi:splicing factor ESS-2 homolog [Drosophila bipectinata]|uniref:splicing factor ESS-2 homolog n=1 Tax=Drosophila bipectinata TaxID=42026 RepID=UPI001C8A8DC0|nr:splicing factor ESS-2 homolog [Drosophila bipectinata]